MGRRDKWMPAEEAYCRRLVEEEHLNDAEIAARFRAENIPRTYKAIQRKRQREGWYAKARPSPFPRFDRELTLEADRVLIVADVHAPFHAATWLNRVMGLAIALNVTGLGIAGDLADLSAFSYFGRQVGLEASEEFEAIDQLMSAFTLNFEHIVYAGGNHEERLPKMLKGLVGVKDVMALWVKSDKVEITDYHWFRVQSGGETFEVHHPESVSINATIVPKKLAVAEGCHIIAGHGHLWGMTRDPSNRYWCIDSGICADPKRLAYTNLWKKGRPKMAQGAVLILDGTPVLLSPDNIAFYEEHLSAQAA